MTWTLHTLRGLCAGLGLAITLAGCGGGGSSSTTTDGGTTTTVNAPTLTTQPLSQSIVSGATATFTVDASGTAPLTYQWQRDGSAIDGATAASFSTGTAGSYTVVVSNSAGSVTSSAAVLTVTTTPTTTTEGAWNLATGAQQADGVDTSGWLKLALALALDTQTLSSASTRLVVGATSNGSTPVLLDGSAAITVARDSFGLTITSSLPAGTHVDLVLSGSYTGSVTIHSDNDLKLTLSGASITSADGPALNIQSKQRTFVTLAGSNQLADSSAWTARTLADGTAMDLKATLFSEGPLIVGGSGSLQVAAATKHALASDAHVRLREGTLVLAAARKDGIRANDAFVMDGGALTITTASGAGKGIKVEGKESSTRTPLGFIAINAGTINITSHDKAITASWEGAEDGDTATLADDPDPRVTINGGSLTIKTFGTPYEDTNLADGDSSLAPEGIEAKSVLTINGGSIEVNTTDDALNAGTGIVINGGRVYARSSTNDAIDSNGTMTITGGIVVADGASGAEGGLDCDNNTFTVTGGVFVGIGGRNSGVTPSVTTQNTVSLRNAGASLLVLRDAAGNAVFAFTVPEASSALLLTSPLIKTGGSYTVVSGGTLGSVGEDWHGLAVNPTTHSGGTAGSSFTVSKTVTAL